MSLVIARDGRVYIVVNAEKLTPLDANLLANKILRESKRASQQYVKEIVGEVAKRHGY